MGRLCRQNAFAFLQTSENTTWFAMTTTKKKSGFEKLPRRCARTLRSKGRVVVTSFFLLRYFLALLLELPTHSAHLTVASLPRQCGVFCGNVLQHWPKLC